MTTARTCPICKNALPAGPPPASAPFCGPRCKKADLGNWLDNRYVIDAGPAPTHEAGMPGEWEAGGHE